jgi:hypothetical protein
MWIPLREAVARAGDVELVRAALVKEEAMARAPTFLPSGIKMPDHIPPEWWSAAKIDHAASRASFVTHYFEVTAFGIELEPNAVEALWPVKSKQKVRKGGRNTRRVGRRKSGARRSSLWPRIEEHFDHEIADHGPFESLNKATDAVELFLKGLKRGMHRRTIERGIKKHRPGWFEGEA